MMFVQSVLCIDNPRPLVTNPTISSPGTGLQHLENLAATSFIPSTITPLFEVVFLIPLFLLSSTESNTSLSLTIVLWTLLYSSRSLFTICPSFNPPWPTDATTESQSLNPYFKRTLSVNSGFIISDKTIAFALQYLSIKSLPLIIFSSLFCCLNHWLILFLACVLFTIFNQSILGPVELLDVTISTRSPFWIL